MTDDIICVLDRPGKLVEESVTLLNTQSLKHWSFKILRIVFLSKTTFRTGIGKLSINFLYVNTWACPEVSVTTLCYRIVKLAIDNI